MLNTVKDILHSVGDHLYSAGDSTGAFAKHIGLSSAGVARSVGGRSVDVARSVGERSVHVARSVGERSVEIARDIGPKRALIGAAILAVAVGGGIVLVRYLRRRDQERYDSESMDASDAAGGVRRNSRIGRAERRAVNTASSIGR